MSVEKAILRRRRSRGLRIIEERVIVNSPQELVKRAMELSGLSLRKLARFLDVTHVTLLRYRDGKITIPRGIFEQLRRLGERIDAIETREPYWGQRLGGRMSPPRKLSPQECRNMQRKGVSMRKRKLESQARAALGYALQRCPLSLGKAVGLMLGDGSLDNSGKFKFSANELELHRSLSRCIGEICGKRASLPRVSMYEIRTYVPAIFRAVLDILGVPRGRKSLTNPQIPEKLINSKELNVLKGLATGLLETDGHPEGTHVTFSQSIVVGEEELRKELDYTGEDGGTKSYHSIPPRRLQHEMPELYEEVLQKYRSNLVDGLSQILSKLGVKHTIHLKELCLHKHYVSAVWEIYIGKEGLQELANLPFDSGKWREAARKWHQKLL